MSTEFLPNELLSIIHEEAILEYYETTSTQHVDRATLKNISLVCKRWRQNSLENGRIWAALIDLDRNTFSWVQELVRRAKASPLGIRSDNSGLPYKSRHRHDGPKQFWTKKWRYAFENADHWGFFSLQVALLNNKPNLNVLSDGLRRPTPKLESFTLHNTHTYEARNGESEEEQFVLPENLFGGNAPHLKTFCVENVHLPPSLEFSNWNNLTIMRVNHDIGASTFDDLKLTAKHWLEFLRPLKLLECLELDGPFNSTLGQSSHDFDSLSDVHLECLSLLTLGTDWGRESIFDVFAKLVIPSTCKVSIRVAHWGHEEYPPFAFDRLKLGLDRHVRGMLADNDDDSLVVDLHNSLEGLSFSVEIRLDSAESLDVPNFEFAQSSVACEDESWPTVRNTHSAPDLDGIPPASTPNYPFSRLLAAMKDIPASTLSFWKWPRIVAEDVDPLCRFLSRCEHAEYIYIHSTDLVILDILYYRRNSQIKTLFFFPIFTLSGLYTNQRKDLYVLENSGLGGSRLENYRKAL